MRERDLRKNAPIRLVVAEDHDGVRQALVRMLRLQEDMEVVGEAADGREAVRLAATLAPDVLLLDVRMPEMDGIKVIEELRRAKTPTRIVVLSAHEDESYISDAVKSGADSYLLKGMPMRSVIDAVRSVVEGTTVLPPGVVEPLARKYREQEETVKAFQALLEAGARKGAILEVACLCLREILDAESVCAYSLERREVECRPELLAACGSETRSDEGCESVSLSAAELRSLVSLTEEGKVAVCNSLRAPGEEGTAPDSLHVIAIPLCVSERSSLLMVCARNRPFSPQPSVLSLTELLAAQMTFMLRACEDAERAAGLGERALALEGALADSLAATARMGDSEAWMKAASLLLEAEAFIIALFGEGKPGEGGLLVRGMEKEEARELLAEVMSGVLTFGGEAPGTREPEIVSLRRHLHGHETRGHADLLVLPFFDVGSSTRPLAWMSARGDMGGGGGESTAMTSVLPVKMACRQRESVALPVRGANGGGFLEKEKTPNSAIPDCARGPDQAKGILCALGDYDQGFLEEKRGILERLAATAALLCGEGKRRESMPCRGEE